MTVRSAPGGPGLLHGRRSSTPIHAILVIAALGCASDSCRDRATGAGAGPCGTDPFRVPPYVQNPAPDAMTVSWVSPDDAPGVVRYWRPEASGEPGGPVIAAITRPVRAHDLGDDGSSCPPPYLHRVRLSGLEPGALYEYQVEQGAERFGARFTTAPARTHREPLRFIVLADCETEPESTGERVRWEDPSGRDPDRRYLVDQTLGLANNLAVVASRRPAFVAIAGDLVEAGGEQEDWDEFWRHFAARDGTASLAGQVPIVPVPGNHEYWAGPDHGDFAQPASERAVRRFITYFEVPPNHAPRPPQVGRYFRLDHGPITLIGLDTGNDSPHGSARDTNHHLRGERDPGGGHAPSFSYGSAQYRWLDAQLRSAQRTSAFTWVMFHHTPYSVGPHGWRPGPGPSDGGGAPGSNPQSGRPTRALTELLIRRGVDAVFAGHDELWERSLVTGEEVLPDGTRREHGVHVYDLGVCGDGLRSPRPGLDNPYQQFLAHRDAPEVWRGGQLIAGGKHYGHLEVRLEPLADGRWRAVLEPVYVLPVMDGEGRQQRHERRVYDDVIELVGAPVAE